MAQILILTPQLPYPPHQGTTIRNYNLIAGLARLGHEIDLLTLAGQSDYAAIAQMARICRRVVTAPLPERTTAQRVRDTFLNGLPDMALRLASPELHERLAHLLAEQRYDILQVEGIEMARYALALKPEERPAVVFDDHNAEYLLQQRAWQTDIRQPGRAPAAGYSLIQWRKLQAYERRICREAAAVVAVSDADAAALNELVPGLPLTVVPNGVDVDYYQPGVVEPRADLGRRSMVFTGKMDYRPNVDAVLWFADEVLPLIVAEAPDARFYVVGQRPHERLDPLRANPAITITGEVDDTRPYMAAAGAYVVPLRIGGGTRLKVLEAMAMGLPIVSTRLGCDGFPFEDGREVRLADQPAAFAAAVLDLWRDRPRAEALGQAARAYVAAHFAWQQIVPRFEAAYAAAYSKGHAANGIAGQPA